MSSITTNHLDIDFNIEAIDKDFAFLRFTRECQGGWKGAPQLDALLGEKYRACAVMFQHGKFAFAMFRRPIDVYALLTEVRKDSEFESDAIIEVRPRAVRGDDDSICEAWLAQILMNSLSSSRSRFPQFHFSNLTGALLCVPSLVGKKRDFIDIAKVLINKDYLLCVKTVRHRKLISVLSDSDTSNRKLQSRPQYTIHEGTNTLKRWTGDPKKADAKATYAPMGVGGKKAVSAFLDFGSLEGFEASRAGVLHQVMESIGEHLSHYMTVKLSPVGNHKSIELTETVVKSPKMLHAMLNGQEVRVVDLIQDEDSAEFASILKEGLGPYLPNKKLLTAGKKDKPGALNLRVVRCKEYYESTGKEDKYLSSTPEVQRQHITLENSSENSAAVVKTIIKELLIKRDIGEKKLSLFNWEKLGAKETWTFGIQDEDSNRIVFMDIAPDGQFAFREINGGSLFGHSEYQEYVELMTTAKGKEWSTNLYLDGIVVSEGGDKNLIYRTEEFSLPDLGALKTIIGEVDADFPASLKTGDELADMATHAFEAIGEEMIGQTVTFVGELRKFGSSAVPKKVFRGLLNESLGKTTKVASSLRRYFLEEKKIRLSFPKQKDNLNLLFDSALNIKYFHDTDRSAKYFVGDRRESVQFSFKNACIIRKVIAVEGSRLIFEDILPTMNVDFVRTGQSTVLPFPFKYLREYMKLN